MRLVFVVKTFIISSGYSTDSWKWQFRWSFQEAFQGGWRLVGRSRIDADDNRRYPNTTSPSFWFQLFCSQELQKRRDALQVLQNQQKDHQRNKNGTWMTGWFFCQTNMYSTKSTFFFPPVWRSFEKRRSGVNSNRRTQNIFFTVASCC